jgi:hypothetical protein
MKLCAGMACDVACSLQLTNGSKDGVLIVDLKTPCNGAIGSPIRKRKCLETSGLYGDSGGRSQM